METFTRVVVLLVDAGGVVLAGPRRTLVDVKLAVVALETGHAEAVELGHPVHTDGPVLTRVGRALVHVLFAVPPFVPRRTLTPKALGEQCAVAVVLAGRVHAVCDARFAVDSAVPGRTPAEVAVELIHAEGPRCGTRVALAFVYVLGAVVTG